jgi:hypothetical protein
MKFCIGEKQLAHQANAELRKYTEQLFLFLFVFTSCLPAVTAVNINQCPDDVRRAAGWNGTSSGNSSIGPDPGVNITYAQCVATCGGNGIGDFDWMSFSQNFSTWLLPWIALIFQLPFGAEGERWHGFGDNRPR